MRKLLKVTAILYLLKNIDKKEFFLNSYIISSRKIEI
jgi:hypothetical protein